MDIVSMSILLDIGKLPEGWDIAAKKDGTPYFTHALLQPDWCARVGGGQHGGQDLWIDRVSTDTVAWLPSFRRNWRTMNLKRSGGHIAGLLCAILQHIPRWRQEQKLQAHRALQDAAISGLLTSHGWVQPSRASGRWTKEFTILSPRYPTVEEVSAFPEILRPTTAALTLYVVKGGGFDAPSFDIQLSNGIKGYPSTMRAFLHQAKALLNAAEARKAGVVE